MVATLLVGAATAADALTPPAVSIEDPPGDADGPGGYTVPLDADFSPDVFDLRRFTVRLEGDEAVLEATLGAAVVPPGSLQRSNSVPAPLTSGLFLQNVDIYVDTAPTAPGGSSVSMPGRRVTFADGRTWERAVVLTPQPPRTRSLIAKALGATAASVFVPDAVEVRGRTVAARVPLAFLGGPPRPSWGWSVHISGAAWESSFTVLDRLAGAHEYDAFTLPVETTAGRWNFGGAPLGRWHPQVLDVLAPTAALQRSALSSQDAPQRRFAAVSFVYGVPPPARASSDQPAPPERVPAVPPSERLRPSPSSTSLDASAGASSPRAADVPADTEPPPAPPSLSQSPSHPPLAPPSTR